MRLRAPLLLAVLALPGTAAAQSLPAPGTVPHRGLLRADGPIYQITRAGPRIILNGAFNRIGPYVGGGVLIDPASGAVEASGPPRAWGAVSDAIPDGAGGLFIGGDLQRAGDVVTSGVAHLRADGTPDPGFRARAGFGDAFVLAGSRLYVGDYFKGVLALDAATGRPVAGWNPPDLGAVTELELAGGRLFAGGDGGVTALDPATGAADASFRCTACGDPTRVTALAHDDRRLFVGTTRRGVFAVDLQTGATDPAFAPAPNRVADLDDADRGPLVFLRDGGRLIVGGRGMALGGPSSTLASLDTATGAADPGFAAGFDRPVHDLLARGDALIAAGAGRPKEDPAISTLDRATGAVRATAEPGLDGAIDALADGPGRIFAGGRFILAGAQRTDGVAVVDAATGRLDPAFALRVPVSRQPYYWNQQPEVGGGNLIFSAQGEPQRRRGWAELELSAVSLASGARNGAFAARTIRFRPHTRREYIPAVVRAQGDRVYVGHILGSPRTTWPRSRIHVLSAATGRELGRFTLPLPGYLTDLEPRGARLYVTGSFRRWWPDGTPAHLATMAVDARSGALREIFDAHTHGPVYGIDAHAGRLYLMGIFDRAGGLRRYSLASVEPRTGVVTRAFAPHLPRTAALDHVRLGQPFGLTDDLLGLGSLYGETWLSYVVRTATGERVPLSRLTDVDVEHAAPAPGGDLYASFRMYTPRDYQDHGEYAAFVDQ